MREGGVVLSELFLQSEECLLTSAIAPNEPKRPIGDLLLAGVPFIGPGEEDRSRETAADDTVDVPAEHPGLLLLAVADRVHAEFPEHERFFLGQVLQAEEVFFKIALVV